MMNVDVPRLLQALGIEYQPKGPRCWAKCPSPEHDDRDPSWFVWNLPGDDRHARHRCYGCGLRGGPVGLVAELLGISHGEAKEWLERGELDVPLLDVSLVMLEHRRSGARLPEGVVMGRALDEWPTVARRYAEGRGLDDELVRRWRIGYALRGDLRGRVVLPVLSPGGKLIGYQARTFLGGDHSRYLHPKAGRPVVYGQHLWPPHERRGRVVAVEGPFDALAVDAATRLPVGALLGSEVHPRQLLALSTFRRVTALTDADRAGDEAWEKLQPLRRHVELDRVELPRGLDPDDMARGDLRELLL